jgi:hypothetical protein
MLNILFTDSNSLNFIGNVLVLEPRLIKMEQLFQSCNLTLFLKSMFSYLDNDSNIMVDRFAYVRRN